MPERLFSLTGSPWLDLAVGLVLLLGGALLARWLVGLLLDRVLRRLVGATGTQLDDALLEATRPVLTWAVVVIALQVAAESAPQIPPRWADDLEQAFFVLYFLLGFVLLWRVIARLANWYAERPLPEAEVQVRRHMVPILRRLALILLTLVGLTILLRHFNVEVSGLVATLGIGSLALALAAQTSLGDIFSGFMIMADRPYRIGDRVELLDLNTWGDVVDIGLRSTRIRTRDNRMVIIPNSSIAASLIVNHSYPNSQYRIQTKVGVAYGTDIEQARQVMIEAARTVEGVVPDRPVEALFMEMADSALVFWLRVWIQSYEDTRRITDRLNTAVYRALREAGISIPFPQRDVHHYLDGVTPEGLARLAQAARGDGR